VKMFWVFHHLFRWKMSEKQTTFFTINCAEKLESPNQCSALYILCVCSNIPNANYQVLGDPELPSRQYPQGKYHQFSINFEIY
jgi:hypothetical protein